jgi:hypothetical protein
MVTVTFYDKANNVVHQLTALSDIISTFGLPANVSPAQLATTITTSFSFNYMGVEYRMAKANISNENSTMEYIFIER